ncbi:MAG TPA: ATP phosphoribosyltransferase regulatory subunit [Methylophilus sp.]|nr:ATP phosphoribosyltransferase regulatory subunit [Methylophilus sp.]HQQ33400.1 ATP phosphoribosyltransferase regulatory subunit [Methylophilus sp.]
MRNWLLPEYIEDVLPAEAARVESLRRKLLDLFAVHGYRYVIPPMLEYTESLITGAASDLDLATFKVVDQLTGRLMGVRADITPQTARIDAHMLNQQGVTRLCYAGTVLRTKPDGLAHTREPLQLGAEIYGHAGIESDIEVYGLAVKAMQALGLSGIHLDFSHVGIFESLVKNANIEPALENEIYTALQSKDKALVADLAANLDSVTRQALIDLTELYGDAKMLQKARQVLPKQQAIQIALNELQAIANALEGVDIGFDLSELRGYHYHSGVVFAAYAQGYTGPLVLGGRYDEVGKAFGRARPATGFSLDLRGVVQALPPASIPLAILAPALNDAALTEKIMALRANGDAVIKLLPGEKSSAAELSCDRQLVLKNDSWQVEKI